jgi:hypothetical protein
MLRRMSMRACRAAAATPALLLLLLTACSGVDAKHDFDERRSLPSCGSFAAGPSKPPPASVWACFSQARQHGKPAELVISQRSVEGDPIVTYYRTVPGQEGIETFTDYTKDAYGGGGWTHAVCQQVEPATSELSGCRGVS